MSKKLKTINNIDPIESMEIIRKYEGSDYLNTWHSKLLIDLNTIRQYIINSEKVRKIIFEKGLSLAERDMIKYSENYEQYCIKFSWRYMKNAGNQKTQEEFDLLKRYCDEQDN